MGQLESLIATWTDSEASLQSRAVYLLGNILLLAPLAVLVRFSGSTLGVVKLVILCACISILIEGAQWLWIDGRAGDIDDALLNTVGALSVWLALGPLITWLSAGRDWQRGAPGPEEAIATAVGPGAPRN